MFARVATAVIVGLSLALSLAGAASVAVGGPSTTFPLRVGDQLVRVEIAESLDERSRGLMFRRALEQGTGMLFVFPQPRRLSFWMRNTAIPLDIGFFDGHGVLREIHQLKPFEEHPVVSESDELRFALEVNRGWFSAHGVNASDRLDLKALAEIRARHNASN